jgi:hypothetical protein
MANKKETGSWQWDLSYGWCGISEYSDGSTAFFLASRLGGVRFIPKEELKVLLKDKNRRLHQRGYTKLSDDIKAIVGED